MCLVAKSEIFFEGFIRIHYTIPTIINPFPQGNIPFSKVVFTGVCIWNLSILLHHINRKTYVQQQSP